MNKAQLETAIRNDFLDSIMKYISESRDTDVLPVSASELAVPCLDAEGNEKWVLIKVSIPRGTRNGNGYDPYDGYTAAEDYQFELAGKVEKKRVAEELKQAKIKADEKKRAEKKALAEANKNLKELRKIKVTPEKE